VVPLTAGLVAVRFPFSDFSQAKLRPAVVLAEAGRGDWILRQVTSKPYADSAAVILDATDFERSSLQVTSYARPGKLFTASGGLVESVAGALKPESLRGVIAAVVTTLGGSDHKPH
jgi:mRNA interferase MazF